MKTLLKHVWILALLTAAVCAAAGVISPGADPPTTQQQPQFPQGPAEFIIGADISWVQQQEQDGVQFSDNGVQKDILEILKDHGFNWIRLRIFHNPKAEKGYSRKGNCDLEHTVQMAKRIKTARMKFLLDFHYSDTWADPGKQYKPLAWQDLDFDGLTKAVEDYTKEVMASLKSTGASPDMVQVGNEINHGFLWPDGKPVDWDRFTTLIKAGVRGAKQADPNAQVMLQIACGGQNAESRYFIDNVLKYGVEFDILGQSYYPRWHGTLDDLRNNLKDLAVRYKHPIILVEYSQHKRQVNDIVHDLPGAKGLGCFIWEPTKWGEAFFDKQGRTLSLIDIYSQIADDYEFCKIAG